MQNQKSYITKVFLDEASFIRRSPLIELERKAALSDLLHHNMFEPLTSDKKGYLKGPYHVHLALDEGKIIFDIRDTKEQSLTKITLPSKPFRRVIKEYFMICESYYKALKDASPNKIEAIDMGRKSIHNEGAEMLKDGLIRKINIDQNTARRIFTLLCVLHIRI